MFEYLLVEINATKIRFVVRLITSGWKSGCLTNVTYLDFSQASSSINGIVPRWQLRRFVSRTFAITISGGATRSGSGYTVGIFIWYGNARTVANINGGSWIFNWNKGVQIRTLFICAFFSFLLMRKVIDGQLRTYVTHVHILKIGQKIKYLFPTRKKKLGNAKLLSL